MAFLRSTLIVKTLVGMALLAGCASLEERLCNQNKAFQRGYDDVINGRQDSPGLAEGEACKKAETYSYADFHRDYMAGFNKAKAAHCTASNATKTGQSDAAALKKFKESLSKFSICIADEKLTANFENLYEIGYRKEFCQTSKAQNAGSHDAKDFGDMSKTEADFNLCAYQKTALFKNYKLAYNDAIKLQCTPTRIAALATTTARARKSMTDGLVKIEKCPAAAAGNLSAVYTAAFQGERSQMMEEERMRMEQERLDREEANRQELLKIKKQQLELEQQRLNQKPAT